jgi:hypothetical protein
MPALVRPPLDPEPLTPMGERQIVCTPEDTHYVWMALKKDWRAHRGIFVPRYSENKQIIRRETEEYNQEYKRLVREYESLKTEKAQSEFVWHCAERRARLPGGYYFVGRYILNYRYLWWPLHGRKFSYAFECLPGTKQRVFLLCQRGIYKTVMGGYVTPICDLGIRPWELIMISGATNDATEEIVTTIKECIDGNEKLMTLWPHLQPYYPGGKGKAYRWRNDALMIRGYFDERFSTFRKPVRRESSIFGCAAEATATRLHPTKWFFDDLINEKNSTSLPWLEMVLRFFREVMANVGQGQIPMGGAGTCWTGNDLAARLKDGEYPGFHIIHLSVMADGKPWEPGAEKKGRAYTMPKEELDKQLTPQEREEPYTGFNDEIIRGTVRKTLSDYEFACQYECNPEARKMKSFDVANWKTFQSEGPHTPWAFVGGDPNQAYARWVESLFIFAVMDLAVTTMRSSDYTAIWVLGVSKNGMIYVLDGVYDKMRPEFTYAAVAQLYVAPNEEVGEFKFWLPRPIWEGSPRTPLGMLQTAWRPDHIAIEKGLLTESFEAGMAMREKEDGIGINWEKVSIMGMGKNKGKRDRIEKAIGRTWGQQRIRVRADIVKPSLYAPGGVIDVTRALRKEYVGFDDESNPDDGMDALSLGAQWFLWEGEELPELEDKDELALAKRRFAAQLVGGILRLPEDDEERKEWEVEEGELIPDAHPDIDPYSLDWQPLRG